MGSPIVIPDSVCPGAAIETLGGLAFEPLDRNGLGAQFLSLKGISLVAGRAPEPLHGARGRSGVPLAFCVTLAHPFHSEGGVEYARLPSVGASSDTSDELLSGKSKWRPMPHSIGVSKWSRDALQKY